MKKLLQKVGSANVTVYNTCNTFTTAQQAFTITAPTSTTWNGTVWDFGTPTAAVDAIISGNYTTQANGPFTAQSLNINSGNTITINSGTSLTIANTITNNAGATGIIVESNGNLIQTNEAVNTGLITVKRNSALMYRYDYTLWSSPVSGQNLKNFSASTLNDRFYLYNSVLGTNGNYESVFPAQNQATYNFAKAKGYLGRSPDTYANYISAATLGVSYPGVSYPEFLLKFHTTMTTAFPYQMQTTDTSLLGTLNLLPFQFRDYFLQIPMPSTEQFGYGEKEMEF